MSKSGSLKAYADTDNPVPPIRGWHFRDGMEWCHDSKLECTVFLTDPCRMVTFKLLRNSTGGLSRNSTAIRNNSYCEGSYVPVDDLHHRGRPVSLITMTLRYILNSHYQSGNSYLLQLLQHASGLEIYLIVESYSDLTWRISPTIFDCDKWYMSKFAGGMCPAASGTWQAKELTRPIQAYYQGSKNNRWVDIYASLTCQTHS